MIGACLGERQQCIMGPTAVSVWGESKGERGRVTGIERERDRKRKIINKNKRNRKKQI